MKASFPRQVRRNRLRLLFFLLLYFALSVVAGYVVGLSAEAVLDPESHVARLAYGIYLPWDPRSVDGYPRPLLGNSVFWTTLVFLAVAYIYFGHLSRNGRRIILSVVGGRALQEARFRNVMEEMAIAAGIATPTLWLVEDPSSNAFACGDPRGEPFIAVTRGLLERLDRDELQTVVAHETAHLRNGDTRLMTLLFGVSRALDLVSWIAFGSIRILVWGFQKAQEQVHIVEVDGKFEGLDTDVWDQDAEEGEVPLEPIGERPPPGAASPYWVDAKVRNLRKDFERMGPITVFLAVVGLLLAYGLFAVMAGALLYLPFLVSGSAKIWVLAVVVLPLGFMLLRLAVSRNREYQADATAVALTRNPNALRTALLKLWSDDRRPARLRASLAHLCIAPLSIRERRTRWGSYLEEWLTDFGVLDRGSRKAVWRVGHRAVPFVEWPLWWVYLYLVSGGPLLLVARFLRAVFRALGTHPPLDERIRRVEDMS